MYCVRARTKHASAATACVVALLALAGCTGSALAGDSGSPTGTDRAISTVASSGAPPPPSSATPSKSRATPGAATARTSGNPAAGGPTTSAQQAGDRTAQAMLTTLAVKGRAAKTGYSRDAFGPPWTDDNDDRLGHNGCDTRNDILRRDLAHVVLKPNTNRCVALTGTLHDPYTGTAIAFQRGVGTSTAVQIDHVVALSNAWQTGAQYWSAAKRRDLANDPLELLAVDGPANESKGDGDAATWLPPNKSYRCAYVARQVAVKARYGLWVTPAEHDAIARILSACPDQLAPTESGSPPTSGSTPRTPKSTPRATNTARAPFIPNSPAVYYKNCDAVRAAGKAPLLRGQPGYSSKLDRDGDGVACES